MENEAQRFKDFGGVLVLLSMTSLVSSALNGNYLVIFLMLITGLGFLLIANAMKKK